jgi:hypothetical protein
MKNTLFFFALLLAFASASGCYETTDNSSLTTDQEVKDLSVLTVGDRGGDGSCCCSLVVSSTYFAGLTICGLEPGDGTSNNFCDRFCTTTCGQGSGYAKTFPVGKDPLFCIYSGSPFRITNNGVLDIQIFFICNGTPSSPTTIPALSSVVFTNDCNGTTTLFTETPCNG